LQNKGKTRCQKEKERIRGGNFRRKGKKGRKINSKADFIHGEHYSLLFDSIVYYLEWP
jgi:hypothetical protein